MSDAVEGTPSPRRPPALALAVDWLAAVLVAIGVIVQFTGGGTWQLGPARLALHDSWRLFGWAVVLLGLRNWRVRQPASFGWPAAWRWLLRHDSEFVDEERLFEPPRSWRYRVAELACVLSGFSLLVMAMTWPQVRHMDSVPDLGDPLFSIWRIDWVSHQIIRNPLALFDANIFYPERLTLTYSDSLVVPGLMSAPLFWAGVHPVLAYNVLLLTGFVLSGAAAFYLIRALTGRRDAAVVGAAIFTLYSYRYEHYSHLELQMTMGCPIALWMLHRTLARGRVRDGLATGVAFAVQTLSSLYTGLFLALCMIPLAGTLWLARRRPRAPLKALAAGTALAGVLIAPVAAAYTASKPLMGDRAYSTVAYYSAEPSDYLKPHFRSAVYGRWSDGGHPERQLFPRLTPVVLTVVALWPPLSVARIGYALSLGLALDGSLGTNGAVYPWLYAYVPPFRGLRVPARFSVLAGLILAVLGGYGATRILSRWPQRRHVLTGALLALVILEALPFIPLEHVWREPPAIYAALAGRPPAVLAEFPMPKDVRMSYFDTRYLYFATFHRQKLVNGNSGFFPPSYIELLARASDFPSDGAIAYLRSRGVEYVGVHGAFYEPAEFERVRGIIARTPDLELVSAAPWEGSESRLYRLRP